MSQIQPQSSEGADLEARLEAKVERLIEEKLSKVLSGMVMIVPVRSAVGMARPSNDISENHPITKARIKGAQPIDWGGMSNAQLWSTKMKGISREKIRRCFNAIALYNDTIATGDNDRLAVTNQAIRELSGVNGLLVGDWIAAHADEVITHNCKYGMQPKNQDGNPARKKTGEVRTDSYYNKRHGADKVAKILRLINEQCLDGQASVKALPTSPPKNRIPSKAENVKCAAKHTTLLISWLDAEAQ